MPFLKQSELRKWARKSPEPTEAQREAGNYEKGHIRFHGLDIAIETPKGRRRRPEWPPMAAHYGYLKRTLGRDADSLDVFIGPNESSELVYVIDQSGPSGKRFDEHKIMLGFDTQADAVDTYRKCYTPDWTVGPVTAMTIGQFKAWLEEGDHKKPLHCQVSKYEISTDLYLAPDEVATALGAIERYEWRADQHPRWEQGSAGSVGGRFRGQGSSRLREVAALPDNVKEGHSLHLSALGNRDRRALEDWSKRLNEAVAHVKGDDEEGQWQSTNKGYVRALLQEMNERDKDARARGVRLSDYVNANGLIPDSLASRLHGGRRFFDPELIRDKLKADPAVAKKAEDKSTVRAFQQGTREERKEMLKPESNFREAIMRAMGLNPDLKGKPGPGDESKTTPASPAPSPDSTPATTPPKDEPKKSQAPEPAPKATPPQQKTGFDAIPKQSQKKIDAAIRSSDPEMSSDMVADLRGEVVDSWKQLSDQADEHNTAIRQIMGGFSKHWGLISARLKQGADPDKIKGFDEMVDFARSHYPGVLSQNRGESDTGSDEESLAKVLIQGLKPVPKPWDDEVIRTASQRIGVAMAAASRFQPNPELESVPFSVSRWAEIVRYAMNQKLPIPFFGTIAL